MELKLNDEQYEYLSQFEDRFYTAVFADWARKPSPVVMQSIHRIWCEVTGRKEILRDSCAHCILRLMKDIGNLYYQEKAERERRAEEAAFKAKQNKPKEAEIKPQDESKSEEGKTASPQPKKAVKGRKTSNKKK